MEELGRLEERVILIGVQTAAEDNVCLLYTSHLLSCGISHSSEITLCDIGDIQSQWGISYNFFPGSFGNQ